PNIGSPTNTSTANAATNAPTATTAHMPLQVKPNVPTAACSTAAAASPYATSPALATYNCACPDVTTSASRQPPSTRAATTPTRLAPATRASGGARNASTNHISANAPSNSA